MNKAEGFYNAAIQLLGLDGLYMSEEFEGLSDEQIKKVKEKATEIVQEKRVGSVQKSLMSLADRKQSDAERLILGYKATPKQIERYEDKYERAKEGEFDDAVNAVIIEKFEAMRSAIRQYTDMIEEYRGFVDDLIQAGELDKAEKAIEAGQSLGAETTEDEIQDIFEAL